MTDDRDSSTPQHSDRYVPPVHIGTENTTENNTSDTPYMRETVKSPYIPVYAPQNSQHTSSESGKQRRKSVGIPAAAALCVVCSLLGGALSIGGYRLLAGNDNNGGTTYLSSVTDDGTLVSNTSTTTPSSDSTNDSDDNKVGDVSINVESVTSPATAVAKKVLPSIVGISVRTTTTSAWYGESVSTSEGSGVIFTEDGYIITNYHVISGTLTSTGEMNQNSTLNVYLYEDSETAIAATVVGYDIGSDLAVIKIDKTGLTAVEIGDSDAISVGDIAIALGNPGGLEFMGSVSQGIISGLNRSIQTDTSYEELLLIQTDAAINPGNSGGALVDINGNLIGINSAKLVAEEYEGMGFAIPVNDVVAICTDIVKNGNTQTAYLGIEINSSYSAAYLERLGYPGGLLVDSVATDSPAAKAGIEAEDILVSFNGTEITTADELKEAKLKCSAGDTVTIRVYRLTARSSFGRWTGEYLDISVTLA